MRTMAKTAPATPGQRGPAFRARHACALLLALAAAGCERYQTHETHGVFTLTTDMVADKLDWEGGNTHMTGVRLCSSVDGSCLEAERLRVDGPRPEGRRHHRISVHQTHDEPEDGVSERVSFHDAVTGGRLRCANCSDDFEALLGSFREDAIGGFTWGTTGDIGLAALPADPGRLRLVLVEFGTTTYRLTPLGEVPAAQFQHASVDTAPDDSGVAWYLCDALCTLYAHDREARTLTAYELPCDADDYLDIGWLGSKAYPQHYWSANTHTDTLCLAGGQPALPRGPGETWAPVRDDDPPHPTDAAALPAGRNVPLP